ILCISTSYIMSWLLIGGITIGGKDYNNLWWQLASIISCGTLAAVLIPEFTKVFTSSHSKHVHEIVIASREGGASLTILSGLVAGNFSALWNGLLIAALMGAAFFVSGLDGGINEVMRVQLVKEHSPALDKLDAGVKGPIKKELEAIQNHKSPTLEANTDDKTRETIHKEMLASKGETSAARDAALAKLDAGKKEAVEKELLAIRTRNSPTLATLDPLLRNTIEAEIRSTTNLVGVGSIFAFGLVAFGFLCMG